jgi:N-formylglutamate amidohydrolase
MADGIESIPGVAEVEVLRGAGASGGVPDLLIEVPHGADERAHYETLRRALHGDLPAGLEAFFFVNTDTGAWAYGRATARRIIAREPARSALLIRSLVPRTFIDCNRPADFGGGELAKGGLTAGIPAYIEDAADKDVLLRLHAQYVALVRRAFDLVCGGGGLALVPHTYGPRTMGIDRVDEDIVQKLEWACAPERETTWPLRPEVDLLTRDGDGNLLAPAGMEDALTAAFTDAGFAPDRNRTYQLTPGALGYEWSRAYAGRVVTLEVRRDLLVERWTALSEMKVVDAKAERVAAVLAQALAPFLR